MRKVRQAVQEGKITLTKRNPRRGSVRLAINSILYTQPNNEQNSSKIISASSKLSRILNAFLLHDNHCVSETGTDSGVKNHEFVDTNINSAFKCERDTVKTGGSHGEVYAWWFIEVSIFRF